jgi:transcriptional regulator with XRE-family HTH domain
MKELTDIKFFRKKYRLTQDALAKECGVTLRTVQNWEKGETIPESMRKLLENIEAKYNKDSSTVNTVNGDHNVGNGNGNTINSGDAVKELISQLKVKDAQISKSQEQIDRLIALLEKREER